MSDGTRIIELPMPRLGETMEEGVVRDWLVPLGGTFRRGDPIVEIETDKTIAEVPALAGGRLVEILATDGQTLPVGAALGRIEVAASDAPVPSGPDTAANGPQTGQSPASATAVDGSGFGKPSASGQTGGPIRATPAARRIARQAGVDIRSVPGSGRRGRVESGDVTATVARSGEAGTASSAPFGMATTLQRVGDIAVHETGPRDGVPMVLLHGFAADHTTWAAMASGLARAGYRVLMPDLPGHGISVAGADDATALVAGLPVAIESLVGRRDVHLVAHSLGAAPALALCERGGVATLALIAPIGTGTHIDGSFLRGMADPGSAGEVAHLVRRLSDRAAPLSMSMLEALYRELSRGRLSALAASLIGEVGQTLDLLPAIERVARTLPVRVLVGHRDRIVDWRDACRLSPRVAVHHFPQAGHLPHGDEPRGVTDILTNGE